MFPLQTFLDDTQTAHCDLQIDRFITVRGGGTLFGCYHQACREISSRVVAVVEAETQLELTKIKRARFAIKARGCIDPLRRRFLRQKIKQARVGIIVARKQLSESRRELLRFYGLCCSLYVALGFDRERPSPERLNQLHEERWEHHARSAIASDVFIQGVPSKGTIELIQCLPPWMKKRIGEECLVPERRQRLVSWWLEYDPCLPEPLAIPADEARRVLKCCVSKGLPAPSRSSLPTDARGFLASNTPNALPSVKPA